eukprot:SAG11_NODE_583_length_8352_cov_3.465649_2_plen_229_part_00
MFRHVSNPQPSVVTAESARRVGGTPSAQRLHQLCEIYHHIYHQWWGQGFNTSADTQGHAPSSAYRRSSNSALLYRPQPWPAGEATARQQEDTAVMCPFLRLQPLLVLVRLSCTALTDPLRCNSVARLAHLRSRTSCDAPTPHVRVAAPDSSLTPSSRPLPWVPCLVPARLARLPSAAPPPWKYAAMAAVPRLQQSPCSLQFPFQGQHCSCTADLSVLTLLVNLRSVDR